MKVMTLKKNGHVVVEEIPTNNASSGALAGLPPDEPPVRKKKRKNKMGIDIFQRIRNSKLKEQTMEDQTTVTEQDQQSANSEVGATMRFIQQKRKMQKRQEREKRAANRKQEIQQLSKAKAKDYQKKAGDRQKKIAKDINKKDTKNESFDWQSSFSQVNSRFDELKQEEQEKMLFTWMELSETNQDKLMGILSQEDGLELVKKFIDQV